jgi:hypothetical protein
MNQSIQFRQRVRSKPEKSNSKKNCLQSASMMEGIRFDWNECYSERLKSPKRWCTWIEWPKTHRSHNLKMRIAQMREHLVPLSNRLVDQNISKKQMNQLIQARMESESMSMKSISKMLNPRYASEMRGIEQNWNSCNSRKRFDPRWRGMMIWWLMTHRIVNSKIPNRQSLWCLFQWSNHREVENNSRMRTIRSISMNKEAPRLIIWYNLRRHSTQLIQVRI